MPSIASVYPYLAHETVEHPFQFYPQATQRPTKDDLCLYLHSSGSTGNPRPIPITHIFWKHWQVGAYSSTFFAATSLERNFAHLNFPDYLDIHNPRLTIGCMSMPPFHAFGVAMQLFTAVYGVFSIAVYPPNSALPKPLPPIVPSPENILEHMKLTKSNVLVAFPTLYQFWATSPEAVRYLKTLKHAVRSILESAI